MNPELLKQALEKVGNLHTLVNVISRRVRQLSVGGGAINRPLVSEVINQGFADIALREVIEEKVGWEMPDMPAVTRPVPRRRKRQWLPKEHTV